MEFTEIIVNARGVGCIFYEMISGRPLFPGSTNDDQIIYIWKVRLVFDVLLLIALRSSVPPRRKNGLAWLTSLITSLIPGLPTRDTILPPTYLGMPLDTTPCR